MNITQSIGHDSEIDAYGTGKMASTNQMTSKYSFRLLDARKITYGEFIRKIEQENAAGRMRFSLKKGDKDEIWNRLMQQIIEPPFYKDMADIEEIEII